MRVAPYGSWKSPVRAEDVAQAHAPATPDPVEEGLYWLELRAEEAGRSVLVWCERGCDPRELTPAGFNVRSRVHEYGGGAHWRDGSTIFFSHFGDGRVYRQDRNDGADPTAITPEPPEPNAIRYADGRVVSGLIVCVRETHATDGVVNELVTLPSDGSEPPRPLVTGNDFYAAPRPSPAGDRLCWLTWNHPQLPFTGTELWVAELDGRKVREGRLVAGGPDESVVQPSWSADGRLHWISDRTGWWNLYREGENLTPVDAEFGGPAWQFGASWYGFLADGRIACVYTRLGISSLALLDPGDGRLEDVDLPYTWYGPFCPTHGSRVAVVAAGAAEAPTLLEYDVETGESVVYKQLPALVPAESVSPPVPVEFPSENGTSAYGFLYRPHNAEFRAPDGELPPAIVAVHGGPTGATSPLLTADIQYWTSRGIAVMDVNYGGSTGYGRRYRERLDGLWGVVDVDDCVAAARFLVEHGEADPRRIAIEGGSAGGYTVLAALAFRDVFAAGINHFGVVDLETFVHETHKFEERYIDLLVGPYPERADVYRERSPIHRADDIRVPLLTFQGLDDRVVPPSQSEQLIEALERNGVPYAYLAFEGEGHGFRREESLLRVPTATLYFLSRIFGFEPADELEPVEIRNLRGE